MPATAQLASPGYLGRMTPRHLLLIASLLAGAALATHADEDDAARLRARVAQLVETMRQSEGGDPAALDAKLLALGPTAIPALRQAQQRHAKLAGRLAWVIARLEIPATPPSRGLGLRLTASEPKLKMRTWVDLTVTLLNASGKPLQLGPATPRKVPFAPDRLRVIGPKGKPQAFECHDSRVLLGGGPAKPFSLAPGQRQSGAFSLSVTGKEADGRYYVIMTCPAGRYHNVRVPPGKLRIRYRLAMPDREGKQPLPHWSWAGTLEREIVLQLPS